MHVHVLSHDTKRWIENANELWIKQMLTILLCRRHVTHTYTPFMTQFSNENEVLIFPYFHLYENWNTYVYIINKRQSNYAETTQGQSKFIFPGTIGNGQIYRLLQTLYRRFVIRRHFLFPKTKNLPSWCIPCRRYALDCAMGNNNLLN